MDISVVIVTTNSESHIAACLDSIQKHIQEVDYEVIVSDNGSTDNTRDIITKQFPWVTLVENGKNLGFGTANNRGAEHATGEYIFIQNDDTVLTGNSYKQIVDYMRANPNVGCLGHHLINPDGSHQDSIRRYPTALDQAIILSKIHNLFPKLSVLQRYWAQDIDYRVEQPVDQVMGACMIMPRSVYEKAGGFDEQFFVWFEEVDLQKRIKEEQQLDIIYTPAIEMIHMKGATFGRILSVTNQKRFNRSMRQYFFKHFGLWPTALLVALQPYAVLLAIVIQIIKNAGLKIDRYKHAQG